MGRKTGRWVDLDAAELTVDWQLQRIGKHLGVLAFWETTRDRNACHGALFMCTNVNQKPFEFSKIFAGYHG